MSATPRNPFFRAVIVAGGLFAFTVMSMLAATFGDPAAPPNRFFNAYGVPLIVVETLLLVAVSLIALVVDRRQTLAELSRRSAAGRPSSLAPRPAEAKAGIDPESSPDHLEP